MKSRKCNVHLTLKDITNKSYQNNIKNSNKRNVGHDVQTNDNNEMDVNEVKKQKIFSSK